jgi:NAD(P)-dependent dehydrogenase (short-subunit alcohol dehydrogenase family)
MAAKVILVTGANTGLGLEIIRALYSSNEPYEILLGGRSFDKAKQAAVNLSATVPHAKSRLAPIQVDIEDDDSITAAFNTVKERYGRLDVLVNNAGQFVQRLILD